MGVTGLWRLIEPAGKPVPVETLENKVLAVDISIWLHQMVKGYQDAKGAPLPNAHLMGLFQRLCKLLYFRIKPVFVFDGGVPDLKRQTIAKRQDNKSKYNSESERLKRELALLIGKKTVVGALLGKDISPKKINTNQNDEDIFKLPAIPQNENESDTESEDEESSSASTVDLHTVDLESEDFKNMPSKEKYDLLLELKETRKMNSWGKLHTLPKKSDNFSDFQMQRLLKRRKVQECIEETEKEMGDIGMSLNDLESFLNEEGIDTKIEEIPTRRIASDQTTRFLLINNVKQALSDAKKLKEQEAQKELKNSETDNANEKSEVNELEDDLQRAIKMSLECEEDPGTSTSASTSKRDESWTSYITDSDYSDDDQDEFEPPAMTSAKAYIMQYSDFTHKAIDGIVSSKNTHKNKVKENTVDEIIAELNQEKSVIEDMVEIISEEELTSELAIETKQSDIIECKIDPILDKEENKVGEININKTIVCDNIDKKELSLICMDNSNENIVINLDTTSEDNIYSDDISKLSSSSDDEFEDVSESEKSSNVVQLTLNLDDKIEDDIFADIFEHNKEEQNKSIEIPSVSTKKDQKIREMQFETESKVQTKKDLSPIICNEILERDKSNVLKMELVKESKKTIDIEKKINNKDPMSDNIIQNKSSDNYTESSTNCAKQDKVQFEKSEKSTLVIEEEVRKTPVTPLISTEKLQSMEKEIENEQKQLLQEKGRLDRIGRNISEQMTYDAQELLRVFGIPYIVAPMEAEAQCAFLEAAKLTDGTITDDSDIWLFGGKTVYKNFFNQKKHVLQFLSERIERSYNLTREKLVLLALLVGSDYTTGVSGVGPVTALEILASFPFNNKKVISETTKEVRYKEILTGLQEFKQWVRAGRRTDNVTLKKKLKNVKLTDDFPSVRVVQAYLEPNVEKSEENFTWGEIDLTILRDYTKDKFGWSQNKLDEIIKPVLKRKLDKKNQKTVHDYFKRKIDFQSLDDQMSKRVKAAVNKMDPNVHSDKKEEVNVDKNKVNKAKTGRKRKLGTTDELNNISEIVKVSTSEEKKHDFNFIIPKTDTRQELIPQKEKVKQNLLENKLKAIEIFRKTKIDRKRKFTKKKSVLPKNQAELSESSDSD